MAQLIRRRTVLWSCLSLFAAACSSMWESRPSGGKYLHLKQPVTFPLASIPDRWQAQPFEAWIPPCDDTGADKLLKGILVQTQEGRRSGLKAFCLICPHEVCEVQYLKETEMIQLESGVLPDHPMLSCPCHFSVFDPLQDGAVINGPAQRGLYRFRVTTRGSKVRITHVEETVLALFT